MRCGWRSDLVVCFRTAARSVKVPAEQLRRGSPYRLLADEDVPMCELHAALTEGDVPAAAAARLIGTAAVPTGLVDFVLAAGAALRHSEWTCADPDDRSEPLFCPCCELERDCLGRHWFEDPRSEEDGLYSCRFCDATNSSEGTSIAENVCKAGHAPDCKLAAALALLRSIAEGGSNGSS